MCSQLKKKNLVVNCCPDIDGLPRHIAASEEHHVDESVSDDESDDESVKSTLSSAMLTTVSVMTRR